MKKLIIAEKPSVARNIAEALNIKNKNNGYIEGDSYIITWVFGHLLQLYDAVDYDENMKSWKLEKFPFIPDEFIYKVKMDRDRKEDVGAKKQLENIQRLIKREDVDCIISATDWDREGQIIGDELFLYADVKKPIYRLLLNEWTKNEVLNGLDSLKDNKDLLPLQSAGFSRQQADWIIGINLTSVATLKGRNVGIKQLLNIGRVIMPTLKIIYDRDKEIENFETSKYYKINIELTNIEEKNIPATLFKLENNKLSEKFDDKKIAQDILENLKNEKFLAKEIQRERKNENPPMLFNLSNLQGYITSKYKGWTSDKVLKVAQNLYEKKLITYPRTASSVLDESLVEKVKKVLDIHKAGKSFESDIEFKNTKRIFDSSKVDSHSAITPTYIKAKNLSDDENKIYLAIVNRFLSQFMPKAVSEETRIEITSELLENENLILVAKGKVQIQEGFRVVEQINSKDTLLPKIEKGDGLVFKDGKVNEVVKKPPKHHTEKTLLKIMETCGKSKGDDEEDSEEIMMSILSGYSIGTPATRAETIKKLKDVGYITYDKKALKTTELGKMIVETFPVKELFDLDYTGRLEKTLWDMERNKIQKEEFMSHIAEFTKCAVDSIKKDISFPMDLMPVDDNYVGVCPNCSHKIVENEKNFGCTNWRNGCKFTIWKEDRYISSFGKKVSREMVELLLKNGKVGFHGLRSKSGKKFSGYFKYVKDEKNNSYSWELEFINNHNNM